MQQTPYATAHLGSMNMCRGWGTGAGTGQQIPPLLHRLSTIR